MNPLWSNLVANLDPYVAGEQPKDKVYVKLNTNENPYPPSPKVMEAISQVGGDGLRLYPDPDATSLKQAIGEFFGLDESWVFVGNGSDEVLGFAFAAFFKQQKPLYFPNITYSFYPSYCRFFEIDYRQFPLDESWQIQFNNLDGQPGGIIFPNPNAPTGLLLPLAQIEAVLQQYDDIVIIVDEAYIDFGGESAAALVHRYENLLVVQTCSKSRSLAGLRVGYAVGNPGLVQALERVKNSFNAYPLDALAIAGATASFHDRVYFEQCSKRVIDTREWFMEQLQALAFMVLPSKANFVFAQPTTMPANELGLTLRDQGFLVRYFNKPGIDQFLRISIGTQEEMEALVTCLQGILK